MTSDVQAGSKHPSKAWYLLPIFLGIIGGLIMFFVLKDEDRKMAKKGLILSLVLTAVGIALGIAVQVAVLSAIGSNFNPSTFG